MKRHRTVGKTLNRFAAKSRRAKRKLHLESLEQRQLLAVGPQLIAINPNDGDVLQADDVRNVAPQDLTFRFNDGQVIDSQTLGGIQVVRSGFDDSIGDGNDMIVDPGFIGIGEEPNEVIVRFASSLPDDLYRISISGSGLDALRNDRGEPFNDGTDFQIDFELDLGAQIVAVVPQPIVRVGDELAQDRDTILVYFNDDTLEPASAMRPDFYQLIFTHDTATNADDDYFYPDFVSYDADTNVAELVFEADINANGVQDENALAQGTGTYRLRIGTDELRPSMPDVVTVDTEPGSSFATAFDLGAFGGGNRRESRELTQAIEPVVVRQDYPGDGQEPGHRDIPAQTHVTAPDSTPGISTIAYNFKDLYGIAPDGSILLNLITEQQKRRAREVFELYGSHLGVQFVETNRDGLTIVTGDLRAVVPTAATGPGGRLSLSGEAVDPLTGQLAPTAVMDAAEIWDDGFGQTDDTNKVSWFRYSMREVGRLLGIGPTDELPPVTVANDDPGLAFDNVAEPVFPGDHDIVHGQHLYRPEANDIDLYRFTVETRGRLTAETIAERHFDSSQLDTVINLYRANADGTFELLARNDDYFSEDSFLGLLLAPGTYFIGISASGNNEYNPRIENGGSGGKSQGFYDLRLNFRPDVRNSIIDATGVPLDGDANGVPGGVYDFWFRTQPLERASFDSPQTVFVDKSAADGGTGSIGAPFNNLGVALSSAQSGDVVRVVGNGGSDDDLSTVGDAFPYEIGFDGLGRSLQDGATMKVPQDVTVMIDEGAVFKLRRAAIEVGSSSPEVDRSGGSLQILGTPNHSVFFTSFNDESIGVDGDDLPQTPIKGDWGGIVFRDDVDRAEGRFVHELNGAFLNYVNHADMRYGGGSVVINSVEQIVTPIHLTRTRPAVSFNSITFSADAAISASPDSFEETNFNAPEFQTDPATGATAPFTPDYQRVGPDIHGNRLVDNTLNALFVRVETPAGQSLKPLTVSGRWDDTDVVHVVSDNLRIQGTPGGPRRTPLLDARGRPIPDQSRFDARLDAGLVIDPGITVKLEGAGIQAGLNTQLVAEAVDGRNVIFTSLLDDRYGAGGTFDTSNNQDKDIAAPGDWTGLYVGNTALASIDHALFAYGGGVTKIDGTFAGFNTVEFHQAEGRITNSVFEQNLNGAFGQAPDNRFGFGPNAPGVVFIRSSQPIVARNVFRDGVGAADEVAPVITADANALNYRLVPDYGRTTGRIDLIQQFGDNQGPLIRQNQVGDNKTNGMVVRGGTLTTQGVWDDTDIVHVVVDTIYVPDFHTFGGLRLESSSTESLVVKLGTANAGFTTTGKELDIDDRIGGGLQIVGQPGRPVILTSLEDPSVGAGFQPDGSAQVDTNNEQLPERTDPVGTFRIETRLNAALQQDQVFVDALDQAVAIWESMITDPITVVLDIFDTQVQPPPAGQAVAAITLSEIERFEYEEVRQLLIDAAGSHESLVSQLPTLNQLNTVLPVNPLEPFSVTEMIELTRANARALGINLSRLPERPSLFDDNGNVVQGIDPATGAPAVDANGFAIGNGPLFIDGFIQVDLAQAATIGFAKTLTHEIGHALGFNSAVDTIDSTLSNDIDVGPLDTANFDPNAPHEIDLTPLDLFRLAPGAGQSDFTNSPRVLDPELDQVFYDGGFFDPIGIPILDLEKGDVPFSTGETQGDGQQASHWKDDDLIAGINLGLLDPVNATDTSFSDAMTPQDKRAFDLIGWDVVSTGHPGSWRSVRIGEFSNDRNVETVVEQESAGSTAPGSNSDPANAEFVGQLAPDEMSGDENRRLGFEIHGFLSQANDLDVFSFDADAGTQVWFDIDRTTASLDTVVELIDANGVVLARSDDSAAEEEGILLRDPTQGDVPFGLGTVMSKSAFIGNDRWTTNEHDAGMRVVLPGAEGTTNTYHVRVRSDGPNVAQDTTSGLTSGVYQLQLRLRELDEIPGTTVRYADIRFANNGVELFGQVAHSPLIGEVAETTAVNDAFSTPQDIGNLLTTERGTLSVAGELTGGDIDWYRLELDWRDLDSAYPIASTVFDLDYADGLARANTHIFVYNTDGQLVLASGDSNIADDLPRPSFGADVSNLSAGSFGTNDPYIGSITLPTGTYFVAVLAETQIPEDFDQFLIPDAINPFVRLEPIDTIIRIAEDHIDSNGGATAEPPTTPLLTDSTYRAVIPDADKINEGETVTVYNIAGDSATYEFDSDGFVSGSNIPIPYLPTDLGPTIAATFAGSVARPAGVLAAPGGNQVLFQDLNSPDLNISNLGQSADSSLFISGPSIVPFRLGDVTLYVTQAVGLLPNDLASIVTIDGFTGELETVVGSVARDLGDILFRNDIVPNQIGPPRGDIVSYTLGGLMPSDDTSGNYLQIDATTGVTNQIGDDSITTHDPDPNFICTNPSLMIPANPGDPPPATGCPFPIPDPAAAPPIEATEPPPPVPAGTLPGIPGAGGGGGGGVPPGGGGGVGGQQPQGAGLGVQFNAMAWLDATYAPFDLQFGIGVGTRTSLQDPMIHGQDASAIDPTLPTPMNPVCVGEDDCNIVYLFDRDTGEVISPIEGDRPEDTLFDPLAQLTLDPAMTYPSVGTDKRELVKIHTDQGQNRDGVMAPGGVITGMAALDGVFYLVSDKGGIWTLELDPAAPNSIAVPPTVTFIGIVEGAPAFGGVTFGPPNVDAGFYAETLFGIDGDGIMHAFDLTGVKQPIFEGGVSSIQTGAMAPTGLFFSPLDQNLWHVTDQRASDPGHGPTVPVTGSRVLPIVQGVGGASLHFGVSSDLDPTLRNYDFLGGAHGSFITNTFSMEGYSEEDLPVLYFNYFLDTEGTDFAPSFVAQDSTTQPSNPMRDSFRVFISDDSRPERAGQWHLLATNNSDRGLTGFGGEYADPNPGDDIEIEVQELFDNTANWRQARVDLSSFAGSDKLRLRFDFSSAGEMSLGTGRGRSTATIEGEQLRALPASELRDGQTFVVSGTTFEFDLGFTIVAPSGDQIVDGETITVTSSDAAEAPVTFELTFDDETDGDNTAVPVRRSMTAGNVADAIARAITAADLSVQLYRHGDRLNVHDVTSFDQTPAEPDVQLALFVDGSPGAGPNEGAPVPLNINMDSREVAVAISNTLAQVIAGGAINVFPVHGDTVRARVDDRGPLGAAYDLQGDDGFQSQGAWKVPTAADVVAGTYPGALRAMDNDHEGVYVDDIVIGFAERGEMATGTLSSADRGADPAFIGNPSQTPGDINNGVYQLEIRRGTDSGVPNVPQLQVDTPEPQFTLTSTFDTNDRLVESTEFFADSGADLSHGQTFVLGDGDLDITFQFQDRTIDESNDTRDTADTIDLSQGAVGHHRGIGVIGDRLVAGDNNNLVQGLDVDLFAVDLQAGDVLEIDVDASNPDTPGGIDSSLDSVLRVFDADGNPVAQSDNAAAPGEAFVPGFVDPFIRFNVTASGTYYVGVSGPGNLSYDPDTPGSGVSPVPAVPLTGPYEIDLSLNGARADIGQTVVVPFATFESAAAVANRLVETINSDLLQSDGFQVVASRVGNTERIQLFGPTVRVDRLKKTVAVEDNGTLDAPVISDIAAGQNRNYRVAGAIGDDTNPTPDIDLVRVELAAGELIRADLATAVIGSSLTGMIRILDDGGAALPAVPAPGATGPSLITRVPETGYYFVEVTGAPNSIGSYELQITSGEGEVGVSTDANGDANLFRDQGQVVVQSSLIRDSLEFGIVADAGQRDAGRNLPHTGPARNLPKQNIDSLAPGVTVANNVVARSGSGAIHISGDPNPADMPIAAVPFARVVNNSLYGQGGDFDLFLDQQSDVNLVVREIRDRNNQVLVIEEPADDRGILVTENASPTLMNNLVVNFDTGIEIDTGIIVCCPSSAPVVGGTVFQGNQTNLVAPAVDFGLGDFPINLRDRDTLFVDPRFDNFYLDAGATAIDSSVDSLEDRAVLVDVKNSIGVPVSPILVPDRDITGQLRVDDPNVDTPAGVGQNVFKDRGALDRADFVGPTALLVNPQDNDSSGADQNPDANIVQFVDSISEFVVSLIDGADPSDDTLVGTGPDDNSVFSANVTVRQDGVILEEGTDYAFGYDRTSNRIKIQSLAGVWPTDHTYEVTLDNSAIGGIRDVANNPLNPNEESGETRFTIILGRGVDFGDAPLPYPTLRESSGAQHTITPLLFLGGIPMGESDGQPSTDAQGDGEEEDGVLIPSALVRSTSNQITILASNEGRLDAWIDFNRDGNWTSSERIFNSRIVGAGSNDLDFDIPSQTVLGGTFARFRLSSDGGLLPTGHAVDGEVEDYLVNIFANPYQNPRDSRDVNDSGNVTPLDAMLVLNELDTPTIRDPVDGRLPIPPGPGQEPPPFVDVNGDGFVSPLDAMLVINELTRLNSVRSFQALQAPGLENTPADPGPSRPTHGIPLENEVLVGVQPMAADSSAFVFARVGGEQQVSDVVDPAIVSVAYGDQQLAKRNSLSREMDDLLGELSEVGQRTQAGENSIDRMFAEDGWQA